MILLSTIINRFKEQFLAQYQAFVLPSHKKALWAMAKCRTEHSLQMLARCANHE
ncbi:MAG: hypothetical protein QTN59_09740 [Candidatus Electrothrix communis]|nr:MAG: hypothetical protein QTN59_09740 [Candidatus Electrothrix communis]